MELTTSIELVQSWIEQGKLVLIFISTNNCSVCHAALPQVEATIENFEVLAFHINAADSPTVASAFEVMTAPAVLLFYQTKEIHRQARFIDMKRLKQMIELVKESETLQEKKANH